MNIFYNFECKNPVQKAYFFRDLFFLNPPKKPFIWFLKLPTFLKNHFLMKFCIKK
jgi:hypothetical protein